MPSDNAIVTRQPRITEYNYLAAHNLLTFKSHREALDGWALCELVAHARIPISPINSKNQPTR